jgi:hypothetical protein
MFFVAPLLHSITYKNEWTQILDCGEIHNEILFKEGIYEFVLIKDLQIFHSFTYTNIFYRNLKSEIPITTPPLAVPSNFVTASEVTSVAAVNCLACSKRFDQLIHLKLIKPHEELQ